VGVLIDDAGLAGIAGGPVSHVVDPIGLVRFAVGVDRRSVGSSTRETFFLAMPLFVAVPADDVGVAGVIFVGLAVVAGWAVVAFGWKLIVGNPECSDVLDLLFGKVLPNDVVGLLWLELSFDGGDLV
jgi:hypothetical protein